MYYGENQLTEAIKTSDFIINILPLTSATENILNASFFENCNPNAVLINVGRGGHVNENDLELALKNHQLKAAYLDVFDNEPLADNHPFWKIENLFITPHVASITNISTAIHQVVENYVKFKQGEKLNHQVNLKRGY